MKQTHFGELLSIDSMVSTFSYRKLFFDYQQDFANDSITHQCARTQICVCFSQVQTDTEELILDVMY